MARFEAAFGQPTPPLSKSQAERHETANNIRSYLDELLLAKLQEHASIPVFQHDLMPELGHDADQAALETFFVAHITTEAYTPITRVRGVVPTYERLSKAHKILALPIPRIFKVLPAHRGRDRRVVGNTAYWRMLDQREMRGGKPVPANLRGISLATAAVVGDMALTEPDFSAEHHDEELKNQARRLFLGKLTNPGGA